MLRRVFALLESSNQQQETRLLFATLAAATEENTAEPTSSPTAAPSRKSKKKPGQQRQSRTSRQVPKGSNGSATPRLKPKRDSATSFKPRLTGDVWSASNWRVVESLFWRDGVKWDMSELRVAWKRCVHAHLNDESRQLAETAPCSKRGGRQFLRELMRATLVKLEENGGKMTGKQARDIGWSAGKQWFLDEKIVDAIQTGVLGGIDREEIQLYEAAPVVWAIANSGQYPERLFEKFTKEVATIHGKFNLQHCTNTLWSMAVCGYHPGDRFLHTISEMAVNLMSATPSTIIPQAVADLLWSLGRLNLPIGQARVVHQSMNWAYNNLRKFSPEELLTMAMGLAMLDSLGLEDMRSIASAFQATAPEDMLDVYIDQFITLTLLFPREHRSELHNKAFGSGASDSVLMAHQDRQAQIAVQMKNNRFLRLISRQLDKVAEGKYEIGTLTEDRNLALEIVVHGDQEDYSVIPVYPMSRCRNNQEIELGEVRIAQRIIEVQGMKFGGFLEWITPEDVAADGDGRDKGASDDNAMKAKDPEDSGE